MKKIIIFLGAILVFSTQTAFASPYTSTIDKIEILCLVSRIQMKQKQQGLTELKKKSMEKPLLLKLKTELRIKKRFSSRLDGARN